MKIGKLNPTNFYLCTIIAFAVLLSVGTEAAPGDRAGSSSFSSSRSSSSSGSPSVVYFGAGVLNHNAGVASSASGPKPYWNEVYTQVSLMGNFKFSDSWSVSPLLIYSIPERKSPEGNETSTANVLGVRGVYSLGSGFDVHIGPDILYYIIKGSGGSVYLSNGSSTSEFGTPNKTRASTRLAWDLGFGYQFSSYRIDGSVLVTSISSSTKRAITPVITLSMGIY